MEISSASFYPKMWEQKLQSLAFARGVSGYFVSQMWLLIRNLQVEHSLLLLQLFFIKNLLHDEGVYKFCSATYELNTSKEWGGRRGGGLWHSKRKSYAILSESRDDAHMGL